MICNSIILAGTGLGAVFFGILNTNFMNYLHENPSSSGYYSGDKDYISRRLPFALI